MKSLYLSLLFAIIFISASSAQETFLTIGSGGGITGAVTAYKVTAKGKVFKGTGTGTINYAECAKIKKSVAKKFIQEAQSQTSANPNFSHPGNMYFFLSIHKETTEVKITWGESDKPVPDAVKKLYSDIQQTVSVLRYKPI